MKEFGYGWTSIRKSRDVMAFGVALVMMLGAAALAPAQAQVVPVPAEIEGKISHVDYNGATGTMTVMGVTITFDSTTPISTPSATIDAWGLVDAAQLPGRSQNGFIGGTAIVVGNTAGATIEAVDIFVEPAENVVLGMVTANTATNDGCDLEIQGTVGVAGTGVKLAFSSDYRMPFDKAVNAAGLEILPCTIPPGGAVAVEGYYGDTSGQFHIFALESDAGALAESGAQIAVSRARCSGGDDLRVQGGTTEEGTVVIYDADTGNLLGDTDTDPIDPVTGEIPYRFRGNVASCPDIVRAELVIGGSVEAFTEGEVDIR